MEELKYTIPNAKASKIISDWCYLYKNTEREVKDGVDPADIPEGTSMLDDTYYQDKYTDAQWVREHIRRWVNQQIGRSRQKQAKNALDSPVNGEIT